MPSLRNILSDRLYLSAVGIVVVFLIAVAYLFAAVLDQPLTSRPVNVDVELEQTGGLFEGSAVTYRGVKIGKVSTMTVARRYTAVPQEPAAGPALRPSMRRT